MSLCRFHEACRVKLTGPEAVCAVVTCEPLKTPRETQSADKVMKTRCFSYTASHPPRKCGPSPKAGNRPASWRFDVTPERMLKRYERILTDSGNRVNPCRGICLFQSMPRRMSQAGTEPGLPARVQGLPPAVLQDGFQCCDVVFEGGVSRFRQGCGGARFAPDKLLAQNHVSHLLQRGIRMRAGRPRSRVGLRPRSVRWGANAVSPE